MLRILQSPPSDYGFFKIVYESSVVTLEALSVYTGICIVRNKQAYRQTKLNTVGHHEKWRSIAEKRDSSSVLYKFFTQKLFRLLLLLLLLLLF